MRLMLVLLLATPPPSSERRGNPLRPLMPWLRFPLRPPLAHSHFPSPFTTTLPPPPPPPPPLHPAPIFFSHFPNACVCCLSAPLAARGAHSCCHRKPRGWKASNKRSQQPEAEGEISQKSHPISGKKWQRGSDWTTLSSHR